MGLPITKIRQPIQHLRLCARGGKAGGQFNAALQVCFGLIKISQKCAKLATVQIELERLPLERFGRQLA